MIFWIYILGFYPLFLALFIHFTRKVQDVNGQEIVIMAIMSALPIAREVCLLFIALESRKQPIFKRYDK